jgi:phosphonate transport system ATP-binding protein
MIQVIDLVKRYPPDHSVLSGVSFTAQRGEMIAVVGGSGSGKTTLFRCLTLREPWTSGRFIYDGMDIFASSLKGRLKIRREWAYLEEKPVLYMRKTALKNVLIGRVSQTPLWRVVTGFVRTDDHMGAMDMLEKLGLLDKARMRVEQLSGGERQRVAIARALVHGAKVIVADEPISGLDPESAERVIRDLRKLCEEEGVIVLATLHQLELAERFASRMIGLKDGQICLDIRGRKLTHREKELVL